MVRLASARYIPFCSQCVVLTSHQVPNVRYALQHNLGLGGAAVVTVYKKAFL